MRTYAGAIHAIMPSRSTRRSAAGEARVVMRSLSRLPFLCLPFLCLQRGLGTVPGHPVRPIQPFALRIAKEQSVIRAPEIARNHLSAERTVNHARLPPRYVALFYLTHG